MPAGSITNTATVASAASDSNPANNTSPATTTITTSADVAVTKSDTPDPVLAGGNITYTLTATNNGPSDAASVVISDVLPANTTFVSMTVPAGWATTTPPAGSGGTVTATNSLLIAGASASFTLVVQVTAGTPVGTTITNAATISSGTSDSSAANNTGTATTTIAAASSDLSITKTTSPVSPVFALNSDVTFRQVGADDPATESFLRAWLEDVAAVEEADDDAAILKYPPTLPGVR